MKHASQRKVRAAGLVAAACLFAYVAVTSVLAQTATTIVDEWAAVQPPPAPALKPVTVDPRTTALLMLDIQTQNCNRERRPGCVASIPRIQALLTRAIVRGMPVVYSLSSGAAVTDIWWQVRPLGDEPVVRSNADKFLGTDLERILRDRGIRTVIRVGTAAHGAIIFTASGAALRGFQVVVPVDGMSAENTYIEQYVAWHLSNAPGVGARVTLTRTDMIGF